MSQRAREWLEACPEAEAFGPTDWAILSRLSWHYNDKRRGAWPGIESLMKGTHYSKATVHRSLTKLEAAGWIARHKGLRASNFYTLPRYEAAVRAGTADPASQSQSAPLMSHSEAHESHSETKGSQPETRKKGITTKEDYRQVKPLRGAVAVDRDAPASPRQLQWLRDNYIMTTGYVPPTEQTERDALLSSAEADAAIKQGWREVGTAQQVIARLPKALILQLSPDARAWLATASDDLAAA